ncbi:MAG: DUF3565 domain-containing protein [Betaproteobacteria bacterium]|nr:MAG: DUF3565 domain-containing protein [Betaproteobacteria bacterium]
MRHTPSWVERRWIISEAGHRAHLGQRLACKKSDLGAPPDDPFRKPGPDHSYR